MNNNNGKKWNGNKKPWYNKKKNWSNNNKKNNDSAEVLNQEDEENILRSRKENTSQDESEYYVEEQDGKNKCQFKNWNLYFPKEKFKSDSPTHRLINIFKNYIDSCQSESDFDQIIEKTYFILDYNQLCTAEVICNEIPNFHSEFTEKPQVYLNCLSISMNQYLLDKRESSKENYIKLLLDSSLSNQNNQFLSTYQQTINNSSMPMLLPVPLIHVRIVNYNSMIKIKHLRAKYYDKFVSFSGTVVRVSNVRPFCKHLAFECRTCNIVFQMVLYDGKFDYPTRCASKGCKSKIFSPLLKHKLTILTNWQRIRVQESFGSNEEHNENGRIPRAIECELMEDLTDLCIPGDQVTVCGVVKAIDSPNMGVSAGGGGGKSNKDKCTFVLYINVNSIVKNRECATEDNNTSKEDLKLDFSEKDFEAFKEIQSEPDVFKSIVNSLCPSIFGHEIVKAGLILGLFGGSKKQSHIPVRSDTHVLVVGDPGLGKSQLLQACAHTAPRGIFVCGNTTTSAGLTVTISKESGDDFCFEAGALLCAHNGCCCIDEFDKMNAQQQTLLEVMEQQTISVAKSGIVCTLPVCTTVLAAANPAGGHYDKSKTVSENLKLSGPLLSRFDLLFILLDKPDEEYDMRLSAHIISLHLNRTKDLNFSKSSAEFNTSISKSVDETTLGERLKLLDGDFDPIPTQLLRKYITYAKFNCNPVITAEAANVLRSFYLHLRKTYKKPNCNPITMRQLESLIRLTQARAKIELRKECTKKDATDVIEIMKASMIDYYTDEMGELDFTRSMNGSGGSKSSMVKNFVGYLQKVSDKRKSNLFTYDELKEHIEKLNLKVNNFGEFIGLLNMQNFLLKKGPRQYQLLSSNY